MRSRRALFVVLVSLAGLVFAHAPAQATPSWAPVASATITPGVQMVTADMQCTANFVFVDRDATGVASVYLGYAAHCAGTGAATDTNGCDAGSLPLATPVTIDGATRPGTLVYSSWLTMQRVRETDPNACDYNDLALVRIHPDDVARVNPSVPHWGGPTGLRAAGIPFQGAVYSYGNSNLRFGLTTLSPKRGVSLGTTGNGWTHPVYTVSPGIPGDSGSGFLDARGRATGVLSTITLYPLTGSNHVTDLNRALAYLRAHSSLDVELARGTETFVGTRPPIG